MPARNGARSFGEVIRQRRMELGLTQEQLAERVGESVRQSDISRMELDYITLPRRDRLEALAAALELTPGTLLLRSGWLSDEEQMEFEASRAAGTTSGLTYDDPEGRSDVLDRALSDALTSSLSAPDPVPEATSTLSEAISRSRQLERMTQEILQRTAKTLERNRRPRRPPM